MKGSCPNCIDKQKTLKDYCCALCALGLSFGSANVIKDPFTVTTHIDLNQQLNAPLEARSEK